MIEDEVRRAFERHEHLVPDGAPLRPVIAATARRRRVRRRILTAGTAVLVLIALAVPAAAARSWLNRAAPGPAPDPAATPDLSGRALNFLIAGVDSQTARLAVSGPAGHADTVIVAHIPADRSRVYLVTIQRDVFVGDPARKLNATYDDGGFAGLARAVSALTGLTFDGAAAVNLAGIAALTDAVGGVQLCVDLAVTSIHTGHRFAPGCYSFSGADAADYLRQRTGFENVPDAGLASVGGLIRDRHQVQFLRAWLAKVTVGALVADPSTMDRLLRAAGTGLVVDAGGRTLLALAAEIRPALREVVGLATPIGGTVTINAESGLQVDPDQAPALFKAIRDDRVADFLTAHPQARTTT